MKYCKDCKHFRRGLAGIFDSSLAFCVSPRNGDEISLITGKKSVARSFASNNRANWGACGPRGEWFEPKEKVQILKNQRK